jgi:hypothetical protein
MGPPMTADLIHLRADGLRVDLLARPMLGLIEELNIGVGWIERVADP